MLATKLFIPKRIKIGFRERKDTFTGKLAYVIYFDEKGILRKQKSWDGWRSDEIEPIEYENLPQSGFVLNKGIQRHHDWSNSGRSVVRVYDNRDFEFEITVDNLLGILMHSDVSKRDITEECVFAWSGTELVLLPCNSNEYQESITYTAKQDCTVSAKSLVPGLRYVKKKSDDIYTYIGRFEWWVFEDVLQSESESNYRNYCERAGRNHVSKGKKHIFWDGDRFCLLSVNTLSAAVSEDVVENYAFLVDDFFHTTHSQAIVEARIVPFIRTPLEHQPANDAVLFKNRQSLPIMWKLHNNVIGTLSGWVDSTWSGDYKDPNRKQLLLLDTRESATDITFDKSLKQLYQWYSDSASTSYYSSRWSRSTNKSNSKEINRIVEEQLLLLDVIKEDMTMQHYIDIAHTLGYGQLEYVLTNGNTTTNITEY
jgi:hypothetical protein